MTQSTMRLEKLSYIQSTCILLLSGLKILLISAQGPPQTGPPCLPPSLWKEEDRQGLLRGASSLMFQPVTPGSKFLAPTNLFKTTSSAAAEICYQIGLEPALINNLQEYYHLRNVFFSNPVLIKDEYVAFTQGIRRDKDKSYTIMTQSGTSSQVPVKFQAFSMQRQYYEADHECAAFQCYFLRCYMIPRKCYEKDYKQELGKFEKLLPLCQWKQTHAHCHTMNPNPVTNYDLMYIGSTSSKTLYGSTYQATFKDALQACQAKNLRLLTFLKDDVLESTKIFDLVTKYSTQMMLIPYFFGHTWTSGRFQNKYGEDNNFAFVGVGEEWKYGDHFGHWNWIEADKVKLKDVEICIAISKVDDRQMRGVLCNLPHFFICEAFGIVPPPPVAIRPRSRSNQEEEEDDNEEDEEEEEEEEETTTTPKPKPKKKPAPKVKGKAKTGQKKNPGGKISKP